MARFRTILVAVGRAANRSSKSLRAVSGNNMFYAGLTLAAMTDVPALVFFLTMIGLVLFLPSSSDPMTAVPRERLDLWPLTTWERRGLRVVSPLLNPVTWLMLVGLLWRRVTWGLWAFVAGFFFTGFFGSSLSFPWAIRFVPRLPFGMLSQLVRKNLREFLTALDLYCALLLAAPAAYFRFTGEMPEDAHAPLTMVMIVMLSTLALTLFGLEGVSGMERYRLLPLRGWQVLLAKGIPFLLLMLLVTAPLSPLAGLAGGLIALAVGQWHAVRTKIPQSRWRFRASTPFATSLGQMLSALGGFAVVLQLGVIWLAACVVVYAISLWISGRQLEKS